MAEKENSALQPDEEDRLRDPRTLASTPEGRAMSEVILAEASQSRKPSTPAVKESEGLTFAVAIDPNEDEDEDGCSVAGIGNCKDTEIVIPRTCEELPVTWIQWNAFLYCTSITSVTIPNCVTVIGESAFRFCTSLTSITIPESVTKIGGSAFAGCTSLTRIGVHPRNPAFTSIDGHLFTVDKKKLVHYAPGAKDRTYVIPKGVTEIGWGAFSDCTSLTSITIPDGVVKIGWNAFEGCTSLTSITIPEGVTEIERKAFKGCTSLTSITIPDSVTEIGYYAFCGCTSLTSITIPKRVTEIGDSAFEDCTSLTSITIPKRVIEIGADAFAGCTSLASIFYTGTKRHWWILKNYNSFRFCEGSVPIKVVHCTDGDVRIRF